MPIPGPCVLASNSELQKPLRVRLTTWLAACLTAWLARRIAFLSHIPCVLLSFAQNDTKNTEGNKKTKVIKD